MIGHFPPEVQNGMVCGNLKTTQESLAFLGKMQVLENLRSQHGRPRREYDDHDANPKPRRGCSVWEIIAGPLTTSYSLQFRQIAFQCEGHIKGNSRFMVEHLGSALVAYV